MGDTPTIKDYIQSGNPVLFIPTIDYSIAEETIRTSLIALGSFGIDIGIWKVTTGLRLYPEDNWVNWEPNNYKDGPKDLSAVINFMRNSQTRRPLILILHNMHRYINNNVISQLIIDTAAVARLNYSAIIMIGPYLEVPVELQNVITFCDFPLPSRKAVEAQIAELVDPYLEDLDILDNKDELIRITATAAMGLDYLSIENAVALSFVTKNTLDPQMIQVYKEQEVKKSDVLEYIHVDEGLDTIGGFDVLKEWLEQRKAAFSEDAQTFGLSWPKGILLIGFYGVGKSACSKAIAKFLGFPLLRLDMGKVYRRWVGDSELAIRKALQVAEALSPVILMLDEIDRALVGFNSNSELDTGVSARVISTLLTWQQETKSPVFLIGTSNNPEKLPPMLYRKGRLDEIWAVDLPVEEERAEILKIHLKKRGRQLSDSEITALAKVTANFTGAELEACIKDALYHAFFRKEELMAKHIMECVRIIRPLALRDKDELDKIRDWITKIARPVSSKGAIVCSK